MAVFEFGPIPAVVYPELDGELWCHSFYLRNLCDEMRFPEWPIAEPVALLRSALEQWQREHEKKGPGLGEHEALMVLGLAVTDQDDVNNNNININIINYHNDNNNNNNNNKKKNKNKNNKNKKEMTQKGKGAAKEGEEGISPDKIKSAYRRLARQYHPDRNPAGRDIFEKIQVNLVHVDSENNSE